MNGQIVQNCIAPKYEYETDFIPVTYEREERGLWIFKREALPVSPDPSSLCGNPEYIARMQEMGQNGWELIAVQPLLRGMYQYERDNNSGFGFGYSLTAGYYLFWKRESCH